MVPTDNEDFKDLPQLDFPGFSFSIRRQNRRWEILDHTRRKYVALTPEEWVRQHMLHFLEKNLQYPAGLLVVEKKLVLNKLTKRADILAYGTHKQPLLLVECKAPDVPVKQNVFEQIARYNMIFKVKYLIVTNGISHFCFSIDFSTGDIVAIDHFPDWNEINMEKET
ncbi:MAG: type I restriction enzyme HsdR N-terminal domain-containing protein [Bacteroidetes bacterium]|nr:type I restriction enzyme HsdR N-terminal domain-containing protein [Bacteroidota bacterium]